MSTVTFSTEQEVTWTEQPEVELRLQHVTLPDTIEAVMRGIEQAARGEEVEIDPDQLPVDDDDD